MSCLSNPIYPPIHLQYSSRSWCHAAHRIFFLWNVLLSFSRQLLNSFTAIIHSRQQKAKQVSFTASSGKSRSQCHFPEMPCQGKLDDQVSHHFPRKMWKQKLYIWGKKHWIIVRHVIFQLVYKSYVYLNFLKLSLVLVSYYSVVVFTKVFFKNKCHDAGRTEKMLRVGFPEGMPELVFNLSKVAVAMKLSLYQMPYRAVNTESLSEMREIDRFLSMNFPNQLKGVDEWVNRPQKGMKLF